MKQKRRPREKGKEKKTKYTTAKERKGRKTRWECKIGERKMRT